MKTRQGGNRTMSESKNDRDEEAVVSPKQLGDYITIASPGSWLVCVTALVLLLGLIVWCIFGEVESRTKTVVISDGNGIRCFVKAENADEIHLGQKVFSSEGTLTVSEIISEPVLADDKLISEYVRWVTGIRPGEYVYMVYLTGSLRTGVYNAEISIEKVKPISLIYD